MSAEHNSTTIPERWPFKAGEAVYFLPWSSHRGRPIPWVPATIVETPSEQTTKVRIRRDDRSCPTRVDADQVTYRGYCGTCLVPAVTQDGALVCPRCGGTAIAEPPPDNLIARWFPPASWDGMLLFRRSFEHPDWSRTKARKDARATIEGAWTTALARLGLNEPTPRSSYDYGTANWNLEWGFIRHMRFYAMLRDDTALLAAYEQLKQHQATHQPAPKADLFDLLRAVLTDGDGPGGPSKRLDLAPLSITRPAGDDAPDGEDNSAFAVWLRAQLEA